jgi:hypothetical protein
MDAQQNLIRQFNALPEEWRAWLEENFERGCNPVELANILLREGLITLEADETFTGAQELLNGTTSPAEFSDHFSTEQKKWLAQAVLDKKLKKIFIKHFKYKG